ncbi:Leucine rich repeats (6 copies), putative [Entamoeba histolytica]
MQLGYNEIMIVSKYFEDIKDFINLEIGIKRFQGNMEQFHFNPIPLNQYSRKLFPNIETFHIYNKEDKIFEDGRIFKYVIWYKVKIYGNTIQKEVNSLGNYCFKEFSSLTTINIPTSVIEIGDDCFSWCSSLT